MLKGANRRSIGFNLITAIMVAVPLGAQAQGPVAAPESGDGPHSPYVVDPAAQVNAFPSRPDAIGWNFPSGDPGPQPTQCKHWQGLQRSSGPGAQYLFVSRNGNAGICGATQDDDVSGDLSVIELGSRERTGERWRSNRLKKDTDIVDTAPNADDRRVTVIRFDGSPVVGGGEDETWPKYQHPGGMQLVGDVLVVPLEGPEDGGPENLILFLDVSNPLHPTIISRLDAGQPDDHIPGITGDDWGAGLAGAVKLEDGRYLLLTTGKDNKMLRFFISVKAELSDTALTWEHFLDVTEGTIESQIAPDWPAGDKTGDAHQMLNFLRTGSSNGGIYLLGARNTQPSSLGGEDWIDLYHLGVDVTTASITFDHVTSRHLNTHANLTDGTLGSGNIANLRAASGAYVSPTGELIFYSSEHDNTGPAAAGSAGDAVNAGEWRSIDMVRPDSPTFNPTADAGGTYAGAEGGSVTLRGSGGPPITRAWLELFADDDYGDRFAVIDYPDRFLDSWEDFDNLDGETTDPDNFGDDPTSARWFAPAGCTIVLNHESTSPGQEPEGDKRVLPSIGAGDPYPGAIPDLGDDDGSISSVTFRPNCDDYYGATMDLAWDTDADGTYETPGPDSVLSLDTVDGPATLGPKLQASHPVDQRAGVDTATVQVANVAPSFEDAGAFDPTGAEIGVGVPVALAGLPVRVVATFTDPGIADTQTATIAWGDGTVEGENTFASFSDASGGVIGQLQHDHVFAPGTYDIRVTVTDDDAGAVEAILPVQVLSAEDVLELVVEELNQVLSGTLNKSVRRELLRARDSLTGRNGGLGADGALDELATANLLAAMGKIAISIDAIVAAEKAGAGDLSTLKTFLALTGYALAQDTYTRAMAATAPATPTQQSRLDEAAASIETGATRLNEGDHLGAQVSFARAVQLSEPLCAC